MITARLCVKPTTRPTAYSDERPELPEFVCPTGKYIINYAYNVILLTFIYLMFGVSMTYVVCKTHQLNKLKKYRFRHRH